MKFFRRIKKHFLANNKLRKYFLYAIGEIILIVIGILIALQLNNWNTNRKLDLTRKDYYYQLLDDSKKNVIHLEEQVTRLDSINSNYKEYLASFNNENISFDQVFQQLSSMDHSVATVLFNSNTFQSLITSGDIKIIPKDIRNRLLDLNRKQEYLIERLNFNALARMKFQQGFLMAAGSPDLSKRLEQHPEIKEILDIKIEKAEAFMNAESNMFWMYATESRDDLIEIKLETNELIRIISDELTQ